MLTTKQSTHRKQICENFGWHLLKRGRRNTNNTTRQTSKNIKHLRSHTLRRHVASTSSLCINVYVLVDRNRTIQLTAEHQHAFEWKKVVLASDCIQCYPDQHNLPFYINTDASDNQMRVIIMQQNQPVAYFSGIQHNVIIPQLRKTSCSLLSRCFANRKQWCMLAVILSIIPITSVII